MQNFTSTDGGLWIQCFRGIDVHPPLFWGYYPSTSPLEGKSVAATATATFRKPWFLPGGTIVDLVGRMGESREAQIFVLPSNRTQPIQIGALDLPARDARYVPAGEVLLETSDPTEEYGVIPVAREAARMRRSAGL